MPATVFIMHADLLLASEVMFICLKKSDKQNMYTVKEAVYIEYINGNMIIY